MCRLLTKGPKHMENSKTVVRIPSALRPNCLKYAEHVRQVHHAEPAYDDTKEDLLRREYWVHFAPKLRPGDKLEMLWQGGTQYAEAIVIDADKHGASIDFVIDPLKLQASVIESENFEVKWSGPHSKWRVVRISDGEVMQDRFESESAGQRFIATTLKAA